MKRIILLSAIYMFNVFNIIAIQPEKTWRIVTMSDGTQARVMLKGDEWAHYFVSDDGRMVDLLADGTYVYANADSLMLQIRSRISRHKGIESKIRKDKYSKIRKSRKADAVQEETDVSSDYLSFRGAKKAIVILAEFSDRSFVSGAGTFYNNMLNLEGFDTDGSPGSVHDYFTDMSDGLFNLTFDVYGPVKVSKSSTYYGGQRSSSSDLSGLEHAGEFICEAIKKANSTYNIDWTKYDWNDDGEVEEVFVLYAGYGAATGGRRGTLWPHMYWLSAQREYYDDGDGALKFDGMIIDTYACSNELYGSSGSIKLGQGTFCHEFSHCMGLPDMYDTGSDGNRGMGQWDLMDGGNYNYNSYEVLGNCPAPWTPWERHFAGWLDYTELQVNDSIKNMQPLLEKAEAYVIYNDQNRNEYYTLHNVGTSKWDEGLESSGLIAIHVDYNDTLFWLNIVNTTGDIDYGTEIINNDHQRMIPLGVATGRGLNKTYYETYPISYGVNYVDSITDYSNPKASLWNRNTDGSLLMHKPLYDITYDSNTGYISFNYMPVENTTGINEIIENADKDDLEIYDVTGIKMPATINQLRPGVYIVRTKSSTKKILIR